MKIVFTSGQGITGAFIRWYTWSWAAHTAVQLDDGSLIDATPSAGVSRHAGVSGSRVRSFSVVYPDAATQKTVEARVAQFLYAQLGKPYDWSAILGMGLRRDWHDPGQWFCYELVAAAWEDSGFPLLRAPHVNRLTPRDGLLCPYMAEA